MVDAYMLASFIAPLEIGPLYPVDDNACIFADTLSRLDDSEVSINLAISLIPPPSFVSKSKSTETGTKTWLLPACSAICSTIDFATSAGAPSATIETNHARITCAASASDIPLALLMLF